MLIQMMNLITLVNKYLNYYKDDKELKYQSKFKEINIKDNYDSYNMNSINTIPGDRDRDKSRDKINNRDLSPRDIIDVKDNNKIVIVSSNLSSIENNPMKLNFEYKSPKNVGGNVTNNNISNNNNNVSKINYKDNISYKKPDEHKR